MFIHLRTVRFALAVSICLLLQLEAPAQESHAGGDVAGRPLVAARQAAIADMPFGNDIDRTKVRQWMDISSRCTMAEFELFLAPLTLAEQKLMDKIETIPAPIVTRIHFDDLRDVLTHGLLSYYLEEKRLGRHTKHTTPAVENELYGAFDCVFASVGPPNGSPRYGEVILRLRDDVRENGWATPFSGMHFLYDIRHQNARKMQQILASGKSLPTEATNPLSLGFDDRLHFSHYVVMEKHWNKALACQAILVVRNADNSPAGDDVRKRFSKLLDEDQPKRFWELFIPAREANLSAVDEAGRVPFGYLEGKFDDEFSLEDITAIEVPAERLAEVLSWPEAKGKPIGAKAEGVE